VVLAINVPLGICTDKFVYEPPVKVKLIVFLLHPLPLYVNVGALANVYIIPFGKLVNKLVIPLNAFPTTLLFVGVIIYTYIELLFSVVGSVKELVG
jgi:hypothetical protein